MVDVIPVKKWPGGVGEMEAGDALKAVGAINEATPVSLASAATVNIGAAAANTITISGTTTISAFDSIASGVRRVLVFQGALTLTHNPTSLILPFGNNITTSPGLVAEFMSEGAGNWRCTRLQFASAANNRAALDVASKSGDIYSGSHDYGVTGRLIFAGAGSYGEIKAAASNGGLRLQSVAMAAGNTFVDIDGAVADGSSGLIARYFRGLTSSGGGRMDIYRGDGSANIQHQIASTGLITLNRLAGETVIGGASSNGVDKLQVVGSASFSGPLKLASFTLATVPAASSGPQGLIYISNLTGGAEPCFSDGTKWRRCSDRTVAN